VRITLFIIILCSFMSSFAQQGQVSPPDLVEEQQACMLNALGVPGRSTSPSPEEMQEAAKSCLPQQDQTSSSNDSPDNNQKSLGWKQ
jgi:hypothetical protein